MKRYSGLHDKLCTIENIEVADDNARKNKNKKYGINKYDKNRQYENEDLLVIIYLNTLLIFILANLTIYVKKNLNVNSIIVMLMI